jgi:ketosteroid isomerase-like protein
MAHGFFCYGAMETEGPLEMKWIGCWMTVLCVVAVSILALLCAPAPPVSAQDSDATARAQVLALEKAWNQAYKAGDAKALSAILDNSLVLVEDDGSLKTKSEFLATVKSSTGNDEQVAPESLTVRVFGNTAIAIGVIAVKATKGGKTVTHRERFIDTWINRNGSWVCIATDATPMTHAGS